MATRPKKTTDAVEILHRRFYKGRPARLKKLEAARANEEIARKIHDLRTAAGLTQARLAKLIGTTASVICRLEDATMRAIPWPCSAGLESLWINESRSGSCQSGARRSASNISFLPARTGYGFMPNSRRETRLGRTVS